MDKEKSISSPKLQEVFDRITNSGNFADPNSPEYKEAEEEAKKERHRMEKIAREGYLD